MKLLHLIKKYIDPAYNLFIAVPPEVVRYKKKYAFESNLKINTWYQPSLFASATAIAILKLFSVDFKSKQFNKITNEITDNIIQLYDINIGGFRDSFNDKHCSIQGTRSAIRIIKLLAGWSDSKWDQGDIIQIINDFLGDKSATIKIVKFIHNNFNEFDGGYTNTRKEKYSDIFSTNSASWILYQLREPFSQIEKDNTKKFAKEICLLTDKQGHIKCKSIVESDSKPTLRATAQYIDLHSNNIEDYKIFNRNISIPDEWRIDNPRIRKCMIHLYNSLRVDLLDSEKLDILHTKLDIITSSLKDMEFNGGYCFFQSELLVPNLLATYYALSIIKEISNTEPSVFEELQITDNINFVLSCFSSDGLFRFYPYSRSYFRID